MIRCNRPGVGRFCWFLRQNPSLSLDFWTATYFVRWVFTVYFDGSPNNRHLLFVFDQVPLWKRCNWSPKLCFSSDVALKLQRAPPTVMAAIANFRYWVIDELFFSMDESITGKCHSGRKETGYTGTIFLERWKIFFKNKFPWRKWIVPLKFERIEDPALPIVDFWTRTLDSISMDSLSHPRMPWECNYEMMTMGNLIDLKRSIIWLCKRLYYLAQIARLLRFMAWGPNLDTIGTFFAVKRSNTCTRSVRSRKQ